jgi:hypothetical protein
MADVKIVIDSSDVKKANADTKALKSTYTALDKQMKPLIAKEQAFAKTVRAVNDAMRLGLKTNKQAIADIQKLGKAYGYTDTQINRVTASMSGVRKNTNRMNAVVQNAGYQFGDFAVQVQSGQNVLVAFSQQGAQLAGLLPGLAGAVAGVALVLGSSLARALMESGALMKSFVGESEDAQKSLERLISSTSRLADVVDKDLGAAISNYTMAMNELDLKQATEDAKAQMEALENSLRTSNALENYTFGLSKGRFKAAYQEISEETRKAVNALKEIEDLDFNNLEQVEGRLIFITGLLTDLTKETGLSDKNFDSLRRTADLLSERAEQLRDSVANTADELENQSEEQERILDYSKELLAVEKERASLAESIEQTFERTARQAKLMQEGMDRGVAGQVASMEMRIAKERELLIQLENAGHVSDGTALSTSVTRGGQLEQYTADLTGMAAKKATTGTEQLTDAQKALQDYGDKLDQIRLQVSGEFAGTMIDAFREVADGTKTVGQAFGDMAEQIIRQILDLLIYQPLLQALTNALLPGMGSSVFGAATQALAGPKPLPGVPAGGSVRGSYKFANGGIVNSPTMFGMAGGRTGLMGEAGPEAILPLKRGAGGKLGVEGGGNVTVNQNFNFAANGDESVKKIIAEAAPGIAKMTEAQIVNSRQRGGQMRRVFS